MEKRILKNLFLMVLVVVALEGCKAASTDQAVREQTKELMEAKELAENDNTVLEEQLLQPIEIEIKDGKDFYSLEKIPEGTFQVEGIDEIIINVGKEEMSNGELVLKTKVFRVDKRLASFENAVLVKTGEQIYVYGDSSNGSRTLSRICLNNGEYEGEIICTDFPSQDITRCNYGEFGGEVRFSDIGTLGESRTADGFWKYAVYVEGKEMASIKTEKQLFFKGYEGIAVNEDGELYMLYYSSNPWILSMFKVDMPEKIDIQEGNWITTVIHDHFACSHYGFSLVKTGEEFYIVKTDEYEAYARNGMDNLEENLQPFDGTPTFEVVKAVPENFDDYSIFFDWYWDKFILSARMDGPEDVSYSHYFPLTEEIQKHYLGIIIPEVEENNQMWDGDKVYESYQEAEAAIKKLNKSLNNWEKENSKKIQNFFDENPEWMESHLEEAAELEDFSKKRHPSVSIIEEMYDGEK